MPVILTIAAEDACERYVRSPPDAILASVRSGAGGDLSLPRSTSIDASGGWLALVFGAAAKFAVLSAFATLPAVSATAEIVPAGDPLERAKRALERARANPAAPEHGVEAEQRALSALKQQLVTVAASVLALEARLTAAEEAILRLEAEERAVAKALADRRIDAPRLLSALQRLARRPADPFPVGPGERNDVIHGRLLLKAAIPVLEAEARGLGAVVRRLSSLRRRIAGLRGQRGQAIRRLDEERRVLASLVEIRSERQLRLNEAGANSDRGPDAPARMIESIEELIDRLARAREITRLRPEDLAGAPWESPVARIALPAAGRDLLRPDTRLPAAGPVLDRFGEPAENGRTAEGVTIRTRRSALVVAPASGRAVFAEPFLDYGELLIIDHGGGYHVLLAGLERLDARVGDELVSGEPIGLMGPDAGASHRLYIELRRGLSTRCLG